MSTTIQTKPDTKTNVNIQHKWLTRVRHWLLAALRFLWQHKLTLAVVGVAISCAVGLMVGLPAMVATLVLPALSSWLSTNTGAIVAWLVRSLLTTLFSVLIEHLYRTYERYRVGQRVRYRYDAAAPHRAAHSTPIAVALREWRQLNPKRAKTILAIDGGGVRGIWSVQLLREIERRSGLHIWELFDVVCGTSTGGILAYCVGVLKMSADECEQLYEALATEVFGTSVLEALWNLVSCGTYHSGARLEAVVHAAFPNEAGAPFGGTARAPCNVFVVTSDTTLTKWTPRVIRSFPNNLPTAANAVDGSPSLADGVAATSAAYPLLPFKQIGSTLYADGGFVANNSSLIAIQEVGGPSAVHSLLSLGTGREIERQNMSLRGLPSLLGTLYKLARSPHVGLWQVAKNCTVRAIWQRASSAFDHLVTSLTNGDDIVPDVEQRLPAESFVRLQQVMAYAPLDDPDALALLKHEGKDFARLPDVAARLSQAVSRVLAQCKQQLTPMQGSESDTDHQGQQQHSLSSTIVFWRWQSVAAVVAKAFASIAVVSGCWILVNILI